jgi:ABC-2 type transport system permease protein
MMTFGITALGVGLGASFPKFRHENAAQIPTGFGGIVYMLMTMLFIGAVILLEAWPVYRIFASQVLGGHIPAYGWTGIIASFILVIVLNAAAVMAPMRIGLKRLSRREV